MIKLGDAVYKIRSKNAGPFWVTIDVFAANLVCLKPLLIKWKPRKLQAYLTFLPKL